MDTSRDSNEEIWKPIPIQNYDHYQASTLGRIKNSDGRMRNYKLCGTTQRYLAVNLSSKNIVKTFLIHRIIALTFLENPYNKPQINHKNGIKIDNRVENLEWVTARENKIHAIKIGLVNPQMTRGKLRKPEIDQIIKLIKEGKKTQTEIGKIFNVTHSMVSYIKHKKQWKNILEELGYQ